MGEVEAVTARPAVRAAASGGVEVSMRCVLIMIYDLQRSDSMDRAVRNRPTKITER